MKFIDKHQNRWRVAAGEDGPTPTPLPQPFQLLTLDLAEARKAVAALARLGQVCRSALASEGFGGVAARRWLASARPRFR